MPPIRLDARFLRNPEAVYREFASSEPVRQVIMPDGVPGWLVTGYAEAKALLDDRRVSKDAGRALGLFPDGTAKLYATPLAVQMLNSDPPDHSRPRRLVSKAFTARMVANLRPRIEQIADELLDAITERKTVDLVEAYAFPLPISVISELLGVPQQDRARLRDWGRAMTSGAPQSVANRVSSEVADYFRALAAAKRAAPAEDMLSALVQVMNGGDRLSEDELVSTAYLLMVAGHETTTNLIGNSVLALLRNPAQMTRLREDPTSMPAAVEEFLRFNGPLHIATLRFTVDRVPVGGVEIPPGQFVMVSLLAANRDPSRFTDPLSLDLDRSAVGHLAFGHGIHYCVGAPLARLEAETALSRLLERFGTIHLDVSADDLRWRSSTLHGLRELPVRVER